MTINWQRRASVVLSSRASRRDWQRLSRRPSEGPRFRRESGSPGRRTVAPGRRIGSARLRADRRERNGRIGEREGAIGTGEQSAELDHARDGVGEPVGPGVGELNRLVTDRQARAAGEVRSKQATEPARRRWSVWLRRAADDGRVHQGSFTGSAELLASFATSGHASVATTAQFRRRDSPGAGMLSCGTRQNNGIQTPKNQKPQPPATGLKIGVAT